MERPFRAIDTGDLDDARALAKSLAGVASGVKLGTTFVVENGRGGVAEAGLPVWPDLKLLEIPRNVARAVRARLGPDVLLVAPGIRPVWSRTDDWDAHRDAGGCAAPGRRLCRLSGCRPADHPSR